MQQLITYRWPVDPIPLAALSVRVDDLAAQLGMTVKVWNVEGLGDARGMGCISSSGFVYLLEELQHNRLPDLGVYVDVTLLAKLGAEALDSEMLDEFELDRDVVRSTPDNKVCPLLRMLGFAQSDDQPFQTIRLASPGVDSQPTSES